MMSSDSSTSSDAALQRPLAGLPVSSSCDPGWGCSSGPSLASVPVSCLLGRLKEGGTQPEERACRYKNMGPFWKSSLPYQADSPSSCNSDPVESVLKGGGHRQMLFQQPRSLPKLGCLPLMLMGSLARLAWAMSWAWLGPSGLAGTAAAFGAGALGTSPPLPGREAGL